MSHTIYNPLLAILILSFVQLNNFSSGTAFANSSSANLQKIFKTHSQTFTDGVGDSLGISPFEDWKFVETEHFRISYPKELKKTAFAAAEYLEEAHKLLTKPLRWTPRSKTYVLITDTRDDANGLAAPIAGFGMVLYAVAPQNNSSLAYYDNWLRLLCIHEYAHILSIDQTDGFFDFIRKVFGPVLLPNALWPRWLHEGLATYFESRFTDGGRGRSPTWRALVRAAVEEGTWATPKFMTLDRLGGPNKEFPSGESPYFFGYMLLEKLAEKKGDNAIGKFSERSASQFPYFLNSYLEETSQTKWRTLWNELITELGSNAKEEITELRRLGISNTKTITLQPHYEQPNFNGLGVSNDERYWVYSVGFASRPRQVYIEDKKDKKLSELGTFSSGNQFEFLPTTHTFLYTDQNLSGPYRHYNDLFWHDLDTGISKQLSFGLRIKEFDIFVENLDPLNAWIIYTHEVDSTTYLSVAPLTAPRYGDPKLGAGTLLINPGFLSKISTPRFLQDGSTKERNAHQIYFSQHKNNELSEDILSLSFSTSGSSVQYDGEIKTLLSSKSKNIMHRQLATGPNGELVFISNLSGTDQLYTYTPNGPKILARTTTAFAMPWISSKGKIFVHRISSTGWEIVEVDSRALSESSTALKTNLFTTNSPMEPKAEPKMERPTESNQKFLSSQKSSLQAKNSDTSLWAEKSESALDTLFPRFWLPSLRSDLELTTVGASVYGFDVLQKHSYSLSGEYTLQVNRPGYGINYSYRGLGPTIELSYQRAVDSGFVLSDNSYRFYEEEDTGVTAFFPLNGIEFQLTTLLGGNLEREYLYRYHSGKSHRLAASDTTPSAVGGILFSNIFLARSPIELKQGRSIDLLSYAYFPKSGKSLRGLLDYREIFAISENTVLSPRIQLDFISRNVGFTDGGIDPDVRGYRLFDFRLRRAAVGSLDYIFPIFNIFRGWDTRPIFFNGFTGNIFGELTSLLNQPSDKRYLPSAGAGLRFNTHWFYNIPIAFALDYSYGFRSVNNGGSEIKLSLKSSGIQW